MKRPIAELIEELRSSEEHLHLEAKKGLGDSALETVSAFSNEPGLGGGTILFGVTEKDGRYEIVGIEKPEQLTADLQSRVSDQTLNAPIRPTIWTEQVEGKAVVAAFVPEAHLGEKPIYLRRAGLPRGAFRRIGNGDMRCSDDDIRRLHQLATERPYEDTLVSDASMDDLDAAVIAAYRTALIERNPATEIRDLAPEQTVQALGGARTDATVLRPTVAGVLLFGTAAALRRLFPALRIDYVRIPGVEWVEDPARPFEALEVRQPLLVAFRKVYQAILDDLPKTAEVLAGSPRRTDVPTIPERVVREALVNALCHRDYRVHSPLQVLRFSNRLEFRNAGHSLVSEDRFGEPGSESRNPRIADVFREMGFAENKGSGIRVMRREMEKARLARPLFESSRADNRFIATLLFAHLLGDEQRAWLSALSVQGVSDAQAMALVYCRQAGEIRNSLLRDLTGLDTLAASQSLRDLRDRGLLEARGAGAQTHYVLAVGAQDIVDSPVALGQSAEERGGLGDQGGGLAAEGGGFGDQGGGLGNTDERTRLLAKLPEPIRARVVGLRKRAPEDDLRQLIVDLCGVRAWRPAELSLLLDRQLKSLVEKHLGPLVHEGKLERTHPKAPSHPAQAYRAPQKDRA